MKNLIKQSVIFYILWGGVTAPIPLLAESGSTTGALGADLSASARINLRIIIPRFLHFQVGSAGTTVDTITFEPAPDNVGDGVAVAGTGGGAGGSTRVGLRSNAGQITIVADNDGGGGGLGSGGAISLSEITARSDSPDLQTPQLTDAGGTTAKAALSGGDVTVRQAIWSYEYSNSRAVEPGSYNAEIVYTAVSP